MSSKVTSQHAEELSTGARELGVNLSAAQHELLLGYLALLIKWNQAYNLTAVRDPDEMVSRHLLDSLSVMSFIENGRWLHVHLRLWLRRSALPGNDHEGPARVGPVSHVQR